MTFMSEKKPCMDRTDSYGYSHLSSLLASLLCIELLPLQLSDLDLTFNFEMSKNCGFFYSIKLS